MLKKFEIFIRKVLFKLLIFLSNPKSIKKFDINNQKNILCIRLNRIGDALVTTPFLHELKRQANAKLTVLAGRKNHFIFNNNDDVDEIIILENGITGLFKTIKRLNKNNFDLVIDLHDDVSTTVSYIIALLNVPFKIGLNKGSHELYTFTTTKLKTKYSHVIERNLEILKDMGLNVKNDDIRVRYNPSKSSLEKVSKIISSNNKDKNFLFGLNISAGSDARFWGTDRFNKLIKYLSDNYPEIKLVIISAPKDLDKTKNIESDFVFCSDSFDEFAAMISKLNFLFTPDTSVVHLASAFNIPMFGLYVKFNTEDQIWYPYNTKYEAVITYEENFINLDYDKVINKFKPFFESYYEKYSKM